jgi:predicted metal-binding membrane protein
MRVELLSRLLRHRRAVVLGALVVVTGAAWTYLLLGAGIETEMMEMGGRRAMSSAWSPLYALLMGVMWWMMMVAMMPPSAAPTVLLVAAFAWERSANPNLVPARAMLFLRRAIFSSGAGSALPLLCCNGVSTKPDYYPRGWRSVIRYWPARY